MQAGICSVVHGARNSTVVLRVFHQVLIWPCSAMPDGMRQCALRRLASRPERNELNSFPARTCFVRRCCLFKMRVRQGMISGCSSCAANAG